MTSTGQSGGSNKGTVKSNESGKKEGSFEPNQPPLNPPLKTFLLRESEEYNGFKHFLRKYKEFEERVEKTAKPTGKMLADF